MLIFYFAMSYSATGYWPETYAGDFISAFWGTKPFRDRYFNPRPPCADDSSASSPPLVTYYGSRVLHHSSQYGTARGYEFVAFNVLGPPSVMCFKDDPDTCVFRTYGPWWERCPSALQKFGYWPSDFFATDFVDVWFDYALFIEIIRVYETYNPHCVYQIFGALYHPPKTESEEDEITKETNLKWIELHSEIPENESRSSVYIFTPPIRRVLEPINLLRLVISHKHLDYYTDLDAVEISGTVAKKATNKENIHTEHAEMNKRAETTTCKESRNGFFDMLPAELIEEIFSYMNFIDLCRSARTCKLFRRFCYQPMRFQEIELQPFWNLVTSSTLDGLRESGRCAQLSKFSLSWCGYHHDLEMEKALVRLIDECGSELKTLRLEACVFPLMKTLRVISRISRNLQELNLSMCYEISAPKGEYSLPYRSLRKLQNLTYLNLYRANMTDEEAAQIIQSNKKLKHLNFGDVSTIRNYANLLHQIADNCRGLISLDIWQAKTATASSLIYLSENCKELQEIDLGMCEILPSNSGCFLSLVQNCQRLKKLILVGSSKGICDNDINAAAWNLPDLQQLDINCAMNVTSHAVTNLLLSCPKLQLLDISFCPNISNNDVDKWREVFTDLSIKKSIDT